MLLIDKESSKNLYTQLYEGLKQQILSGELPTGFILPATRKMAQEYELSRNTVITAYRQLEVEGYIYSTRFRLLRRIPAASALRAARERKNRAGKKERARTMTSAMAALTAISIATGPFVIP